MVVAGGLDLPETRRSCGSWPGGVVDGVTGVLLAVPPVDGPRLGSYIGEVLRWRRCCPILDGVVRCDARMKVLHGFRQAAGDGTRECHFPPWRRCCGVLVTSLTRLELWLSPGESLDSVGSAQWRRLRRRSSARSIVFGDMAGSSSLSSGVRHCRP